PGTEGALALGLAHVILKERPSSAAGRAGNLIPGWASGLPDYTPERVEKTTGVAAATILRLAREVAAHEPALVFAGGAALAHPNGLATALAVNALNALLGSTEKPGGVFFTPQPALTGVTPSAQEARGSYDSFSRLVDRIMAAHAMPSGASSSASTKRVADKPVTVKVLLVYDTNPAYGCPSTSLPDILQYVPFVASFCSFMDETSELADLILPDHSPLESWLDDIPESGTTQAVVSVSSPVMRPLYNTRPTPDVILDLARQLGGAVASALPWKTYEETLRAQYGGLSTRKGSIEAKDSDEFWSKMQEQGGWWGSETRNPSPSSATLRISFDKLANTQFHSEADDFPFFFIPYPSTTLYDGSLAHLPWMQVTPDPLSTAMWGSWVEINPKTA
ncbi:MAG TPA: molybdopterin-dependent oxidoreductase, partial [Candidatus Acidoferrum sp.]|nr:molybdopterin-dependent oxidoreductase [Candidatus Acidoferrum sp.]